MFSSAKIMTLFSAVHEKEALGLKLKHLIAEKGLVFVSKEYTRELFNVYDEDSNGEINQGEYDRVSLNVFGFEDGNDDYRQMAADYDRNSDGNLSYPEWHLVFLWGEEGSDETEIITEEFQWVDANQDGFLSGYEMMDDFLLNEKDLEIYMKYADIDHDGKLSQEEYVNFEKLGESIKAARALLRK